MGRKCLEKRRWFITGVSQGLGLALAKKVLDQGEFVAGTVRQMEDAGAFESLAPGRALAYWAEATCDDTSGSALKRACKGLGGLDVVVHVAGYGLQGALEETTEEAARRYWETHYWAALRAIWAVLPCFREKGYGHFVHLYNQVCPGPGFAIQHACHEALRDTSQSLAAETEPHNLRVTTVRLPRLDTAWLEHLERAQSLPAYAHLPPFEAPPQASAEQVAEAIFSEVTTCRSQAYAELDLSHHHIPVRT